MYQGHRVGVKVMETKQIIRAEINACICGWSATPHSSESQSCFYVALRVSLHSALHTTKFTWHR